MTRTRRAAAVLLLVLGWTPAAGAQDVPWILWLEAHDDRRKSTTRFESVASYPATWYRHCQTMAKEYAKKHFDNLPPEMQPGRLDGTIVNVPMGYFRFKCLPQGQNPDGITNR